MKPLVKEIVEWDRFTGRLEAYRSIEVRSNVTGYLQNVHFSDGHDVKAGQELFTIDQRTFQADVDSADAALKQAEANKLRAAASVDEASAMLAQAKAVFSLAEIKEARSRRLREQGAIPEEEYDTRVSELAQARADVDAADASLTLARANVEVAAADVEAAKAAKDAAEVRFGYTEIVSQIDGVISKTNVNVGNLVTGGSGGATVLTNIVLEHPITVTFDANERDYLRYRRLELEDAQSQEDGPEPSSAPSDGRDSDGASGNTEPTSESKKVTGKVPVFVQLSDEEGYPHRGHIEFVENQLDSESGTIRAEALLPNLNELLTPGLFAVVRVPSSNPHDAVLIPDQAVATDQTDQFVYVVVESEGKTTIERREIAVGPMILGLRIVREGLDGSEIVVTEGVQALQAGMRVSIPDSVNVAETRGEAELPMTWTRVPESEWLTVEEDELVVPERAGSAKPNTSNAPSDLVPPNP